MSALLAWLFVTLGEGPTMVLAGVLVGGVFGFVAQRSRFCLRSAVIEFAHGSAGGKLTVWLFAFATAVLLVQGAQWAGWLDVSGSRLLATRGTLSGAVIGGLMFGVGMILTRGCSSRMLVLAASGNLRALLSGLVFVVAAQSASVGLLSPVRAWLSQLWTIEGDGARDVLAFAGLGHGAALLFGLAWLCAALWWARRQRIAPWGLLGGVGVGAVVALTWMLTATASREAFDAVVPVQSLSFTGPSSDFLMLVVSPPGTRALKFDLGLIPGVFCGSLLATLAFGEFRLQGFEGGLSMRRYLAGALLMGFGGMLAGGCSVGAGLSGASVFAVTSWLALVSMWAGGALTDRWLDQPAERAAAGVRADPVVTRGTAPQSVQP